MITCKKLLTWLPLGVFSMAGSIVSADEGFHLGAAIGATSISQDRFLIYDSSTAYKLFGGYQFNDHLSVEGSFIDFDDAVDVQFLNTASQRAVADGHGFSVASIAQFPMGRFVLTAKAGALFWNADSSDGEDVAEEASGSDLLIGIGLRYTLTERVSLTLDYEFYELGSIEADTALIGLRTRF